MFVVIYEFEIKPGLQDVFVTHWAATTQGIYEHRGSLGSRLHQVDAQHFIGYAQWPDEETFRRAQQQPLPPHFEQHRQAMRNTLNLDKTRQIYSMPVITDKLQAVPYAVTSN